MKKVYKKILFIRIGAIGDVVHTLNAPRAVKALYPDMEIHYLTSLPEDFLSNIPYIDKIWEFSGFKKTSIFSKELKDYAKFLKEERFDAVINFQPSIKTRVLARLAGIKNVYNYRKRNKRHAVKDYWLTARRAFPELSLADDLQLSFDDENTSKMQTKLEGLKRPFVVFNSGHVFAKRQGRTYPIDKWVELGNRIQEKYDGTIIVTGVKEDAEILKPLEVIKGSVSFVDKLSLVENSALIGCTDLIISGDSGPLHIASALGVKVIGLFGAMPISRTGPWGNNCITITSSKKCVPCGRRKCKYLYGTKELYSPCMKEIEVDDIFEKVCEVLG